MLPKKQHLFLFTLRQKNFSNIFKKSYVKLPCYLFLLLGKLHYLNYFPIRAPCPMVEDGTEVEKRQKQVTFDINQELRTQLDKLGEIVGL
jgi:hypothetical protein